MSQIGEAKKRVTGRLKVTGRASYTADFDVPNVVHAVLTTSTIARGRIVGIDTQQAENLPGVLTVITHQNSPALPFEEVPQTPWVNGGEPGEYPQTLHTDRIYFYGQPVAVTVAETLEQAEQAASLVQVEYEQEAHSVSVSEASDSDQLVTIPSRPDQVRGNPELALSQAAFSVDENYVVPTEHHNPIEPHVTTAIWSGNQLTVYDKTQWVTSVQQVLSSAFGIPLEYVNVISPFVGGAFGSALRAWQQSFIAPMAAKVVNRPVKLVLSRKQMFTITGHRPHTAQRVALGADQEGNLTAIIHEATGASAQFESFSENVLDPTRILYSCPNVQTKYRLAKLDISAPTPMRGPGDAQGVYALESAMDELSYKLNIDPLELRLINYAEQDPESGLPWSEKALRECYQQGADRMGWSQRSLEPRSMERDGKLIGYGMASATYPMNWRGSVALARVLSDGTAVVQSAASDMGPGTYTAMTLIAAEYLGIPSDRITFELGSSRFPNATVHGGSTTVASVGSAVKAACEAVKAQALALAQQQSDSILSNLTKENLKAEGGRLFDQRNPTTSLSYEEILAQADRTSIESQEASGPDDEEPEYSMHSFGAVFAEVEVDEALGNVDVSRVVFAVDIGRVINPRTAGSQLIGGAVGGIGMALHEDTHMDGRFGSYVNANLGEYLVPVNADIYDIETIFCGEPDYRANPLGARGIGEISIVGIAGAIANAVYHATGKRIRNLPITPDKILA